MLTKSDEWDKKADRVLRTVPSQELEVLIEKMNDIAAGTEDLVSDDYAKATRRWADEVQELVSEYE